MILEIVTGSEEETFEVGRILGENAFPGQVIAFYGDLGAGKTAMTKGIAAGLGIRDLVVSPTFTILCSYEGGRMPLHHLDVYRIEDPDEMEEIGLDDCFAAGGVTAIEWAENIEELLPPDTLRITMLYDAAPTGRRIILQSNTENQAFIEKIAEPLLQFR